MPRESLDRMLARLVLLAVAIVAAPLPGCSGGPPPSLRSAVISDPKTFNPILITDAGSAEALALVFEGLVRRDPISLAIEPLLATSWEHDETGTKWTFRLRQDVRWHDGTPFTAADVVFTFAAVFDDRVPNSSKHVLLVDGQPIVVEAEGDFTVRFRLPRPFAPFLSAVGIPILPRHRLEANLADGSFAHSWGIDTAPAEIVGTGPYKMTRFVPAQFLHYERNPLYWMTDDDGTPLPRIDARTVLIVPDQNASYLKFLARQTDFHQPRPEEVAELQAQADSRRIHVSEIGLDGGSLFVSFNRNPQSHGGDRGSDPRLHWFTDLHFLRAIAHSVDKKSMVENCLYGHGEAAIGKISPADKIFYNPDLVDYAYDLDEARAHLRAGGYVWKDDELHDANGNRVQFTLTTNSGNKVRERMSSILREDWSKLGMRVHFRPVDFTTLVEKLDRTFDWDAVLIGFTSTPEPHIGANMLLSSGNLHIWHPSQKSPATEWEREIDALVHAGTETLDEEERVRIYRRIDAILHEQLPMIQTVRETRFVAFDRGLSRFERSVWGQRRPERMQITR